MDMLAHCRAMAAFCRQRGTFENENDAFWLREADEWDKLISEHANQPAEIRTRRKTRSRSVLPDDRDDAQLSGH